MSDLKVFLVVFLIIILALIFAAPEVLQAGIELGVSLTAYILGVTTQMAMMILSGILVVGLIALYFISGVAGGSGFLFIGDNNTVTNEHKYEIHNHNHFEGGALPGPSSEARNFLEGGEK